MNNEERTYLRENQTLELHAAIGEFVVQFEHVCRAMQTAILFLLHGQGLRNQSVANILLAGYTVEPLRQLLESLIGEIVKPNNNERWPRKTGQHYKRISSLI
jgi:hypothetical protein